MNSAVSEKISTSQATIAIASFIISDGFIVTARSAAEVVRTPDVWLSLLFGGILCSILGYFLAKLSRLFPKKTYFEYSQVIVGKPFSYFCSFLFILYFVWTAGYDIRIQAEFMRHFLLDQTPLEIMMVVYLVAGIYLVTGGINPIARMQELFFPFTIVVIVIVFIFGIKDVNIDYLRPVLSEGITPVIEGIKTTPFAYLGFETVLILTAFMNEPQKAVKSVVISLVLSTFLYVINGVMLIGMLTEKEVMTLTWPLMEFTKTIEIPGGFIENFEVLFFIIWLIRFFSTFSLAYYFGSLGLSQLLKIKIHYIIFGLIPIVYLIGYFPGNIDAVFKMAEYLGYYGIIVAGILPLILYFIAHFRGFRS